MCTRTGVDSNPKTAAVSCSTRSDSTGSLGVFGGNGKSCRRGDSRMSHVCTLRQVLERRRALAGGYGHWPLFTHPAAGLAFRVGEANDVAIVAAALAAVTVAPVLRSVGSNAMLGTVGEVYSVPVAESPEPPATLWDAAPVPCATSKMTKAATAPAPTRAETD